MRYLYLLLLCCTSWLGAQSVTTVCSGEEVSVTATAVDGALRYEWQRAPGGGPYTDHAVTTGTRLTETVTWESRTAGVDYTRYQYQVRAVTADGPQAYAVVGEVRVNQVPEFWYVIRDAVCPALGSGNTTTLTVNFLKTFAGGDITYRVYGTDNGYDVSQDNYVFSDVPPGTYRIQAITEYGCVGESPAYEIAAEDPKEYLEIGYETAYDCETNTWTISYRNVNFARSYPDLEFSLDGSNYTSDRSFSGLETGTYTLYARSASLCQTGRIEAKLQRIRTEVESVRPEDCGQSRLQGGVTFAVPPPGERVRSYAFDILYPDGSLATRGTPGASTVNFLEPGSYLAVNTVGECAGEAPVPFTIPVGTQFPDVELVVTGGEGCNETTRAEFRYGGSEPLEFILDFDYDNPRTDPVFLFDDAEEHRIEAQVAGTYCSKTFKVSSNNFSNFTLEVQTYLCERQPGTVRIRDYGYNGTFTFSMDGGESYQSSPTFTGLQPGTYTFVVRDESGCTASKTYTIRDVEYDFSVREISRPSCHGGGPSDGAVSFTLPDAQAFPDGVTVSVYRSDDDALVGRSATGTVTGLPAGNYYARAATSFYCSSQTEFSIEPVCPELGLSLDYDPIACAGETTELRVGTLESVAGTVEYRLNGGAWQTAGRFKVGEGGHYVVEARVNGGAATGRAEAYVVEFPPYTFNINPGVYYCADSPGRLAVASSGQSVALSLDGQNYVEQTYIDGLDPGRYTVYIRDANGCVRTETATVEDRSIFTRLDYVTATGCDGGASGTAAVTLAGEFYFGEGAYFQLLDADNDRVLSGSRYSVKSTFLEDGTPAIQITYVGLSAGNYRLALYVGLCVPDVSFTVPAGGGLPGLSTESSPENCETGGGSITVRYGGGERLEYSLDGETYQSSATFSGLPGGQYRVSVRPADGSGCVQVLDAYVAPVQPFAVSATAEPTGCAGPTGSIVVTPDAGNDYPPFTYALAGVRDRQSATTFTELAAGDYVLVAYNAQQCTDTVRVTVAGPVPISFNGQASSYQCAESGGDIQVTEPAGGRAPFTYALNDGGFGTEPSFNGLAPGAYTVTVRDADGCTATRSFTVADESYTLSVQTIEDAGCTRPGSVTFSRAPEGATGYRILTEGGAPVAGPQAGPAFTGLAAGAYRGELRVGDCVYTTTFRIAAGTETPELTYERLPLACERGETPTAVDVMARSVNADGREVEYRLQNGTYGSADRFTLALGEANTLYARFAGTECETSLAISLTLDDLFPVAVTAVPAGCDGEGGTLTVTTTGPDAFTYALEDALPEQSSPDFTGLAPGSYTVVVYNREGCARRLNATVDGVESPYRIGVESIEAAGCDDSGSVRFTPPPADGPAVTFTLRGNGVERSSSEAGFGGLPSGTYTVTAVAQGCSSETEIVIPGTCAEEISFDLRVIPVSCAGQPGLVTFTNLTGGTQPYRYSIDGGRTFGTQPTIAGLAAGNYTAVVEDAAGGRRERSFTVRPSDNNFTADARITEGTCSGDGYKVTLQSSLPGFESRIISGDTSAFTATSTYENLGPGTYRFEVRRVDGRCARAIDLTLSEPGSRHIPFPDLSTCPGSDVTVAPPFAVSAVDYYAADSLLLGSGPAVRLPGGQTILVSGTDTLGCAFRDTFAITEGDRQLDARFLVAGQAVAGQTVALIEDSSPVPESLDWTVSGPAGGATFVRDSFNQYFYRFDQVGTYDITLTATLEGCTSQVSKQIEIVADSAALDPLPALFSEITGFSASPNPTGGPVRVTVELSAPRAISLRLYTLNGFVLDRVALPAAADHAHDFDLSGQQPGTYVVALVAGAQTRTLTVILQ